MSKSTIRIPTPLRPFTGGADEIEVEGTTVNAALADLGQRYQGVLERILDGSGRVRGFVNIYVGEANVKTLGGLDAPLAPSSVISIVPAVAGGSGHRR